MQQLQARWYPEPYRVRFELPGSDPKKVYTGVQVVFYPSRSQVALAGFEGFEAEGLEISLVTGGPTLVTLTSPTPFRVATPTLTLRIMGESVGLAATSWLVAPTPGWTRLSRLVRSEALANAMLRFEAPVAGYDSDEVIWARDDWSATTPLQREYGYFRLLDHHTNPSAGADGSSDPLAEAADLSIWLQHRLLQRSSNNAPPKPDDDQVQQIKVLSKLQLAVFKFVWGSDTKLMVDETREAFAKFGSGRFGYDMQRSSDAGEPASAYFFLFAEFALVAARLDDVPQQERELWLKLLPGMVAAQIAYVKAYRPPGLDLPCAFEAWRFENRKSGKEPDVAGVDDALKVFDEKSPGDLLSALEADSATRAAQCFLPEKTHSENQPEPVIKASVHPFRVDTVTDSR